MKWNGKHIRQWYTDLSFKKKLLSITLGICVFPFLILQIIFTQVSISNMNRQINQQIQNSLVQISEKFSLKMEALEDMVYQVYSDKELVQSLEKYPEADRMEEAYLYYLMNDRMKQFAEGKKEIRSMSLICRSGKSVTYDSKNNSAFDHIWRDYEDLREIGPYRETEGKHGIVLIPTQMVKTKEESCALFFLGKGLHDVDNLEYGLVGTLIISIEEQELDKICNGVRNQDYQDNSITFITDSNGRVLSFPDEGKIGISLSKEGDAVAFVQEAGIFQSRHLFSNSYQDPDTGWIFWNVYDQDYFMRDVNRLQMVYWILLLLDVLVILVLINSINHYFTDYLNQIMEGIRQVEKGNLDVQIVVDRHDEFGRIGENFNHMTGTVKALIQEVTEISQKKNQAEIRALESQINPHFLYNTLDAINWLAVQKDEYEISKMISNLGLILRYCMNQCNEQVTLSELEEWLKAYVSLYQLRYGQSFEFKIHIEKSVKNQKIYKLLIQPFVENAILHGLKDMEGGLLQVNIGLEEQSQRIHITVEDNGIGMEDWKADIYNQRDREWSKAGHIGLANVFERVQLYYGEQGEWHISSVEGMGTVLELLLPLENSDNKEQKKVKT